MADITWGSPSKFADDILIFSCVRASLIDTNKIAVIWRYYSAPYHFVRGIVGTISGDSFTWGSMLNIDPGADYGLGVDIAKLSSSAFATVFGASQGNDDGEARHCGISGTTLTIGLPVDFSNNKDTKYPISCQIDDDKFVVLYSNIEDSNYGYGVVCTNSGTTITPGTPQKFNSTYMIRIGQAVKLATNKFAFICGEGPSEGVKVYVCTVSGTTITFGTPTTLYATASKSEAYSLTAMSSTKLVGMYTKDTNADYSARALEVSGINSTAGAEVDVIAGAIQPSSVINGGDVQFASVYGNSSGLKSRLCTIDPNTMAITQGSAETINSDNIFWNYAVKLETGKVAVLYGEVDGAAYDLSAIVGTFTEQNEDDSKTFEAGGSGDIQKMVKRPLWYGRDGVFDPKPSMGEVEDPKPSLSKVSDPTPNMSG